jgi:hypothetical protein
MAGDRPLAALGTADLEHHDRLAAIGGAVERGHEALRLLDRLREQRDHPGRGIVDQRFHVFGRAEQRLVAR